MHEILAQLSDVDLHALAVALRAGRLGPPFSPATLRLYCAPGPAERLVTVLTGLVREGMTAAHLALLLESVAVARERQASAADRIDLVCTGPEGGAGSRDTGVVVRELFASAEAEVLVVGYAVHRGRAVFAMLARRMAERPGLRVRLCLDVRRPRGDGGTDHQVLARFAARFRKVDWPEGRAPEVYHDPRSLAPEAERRSALHAKCVVVDRQVALVSSANFTEAAQERNIEVGTLVRSARFAGRLAAHFERLIERGQLRPVEASRQT